MSKKETGEVVTTLGDLSPEEAFALLNELFPDYICDRDLTDPQNIFAFLDPRKLVAKVKRAPSPLEQLLHAERVNRAQLKADLLLNDFDTPEDCDDFDVDEDMPEFGRGYEVDDLIPEFIKTSPTGDYRRVRREPPPKGAPGAIQTEKGEPGSPPAAPPASPPRKKRNRLETLLDLMADDS